MRCSAIVRIKSSAPAIIASPSWINEVKLCGAVRLGFNPSGNGGALDKTSRFHPLHVVLKLTQLTSLKYP